MVNLLEFVSGAEKLSIIGILLLVVITMVWIIRVVYRDRDECEKARLDDAKDRADINRELGVFKGKLEILEQLHVGHITFIDRANKNNGK